MRGKWGKGNEGQSECCGNRYVLSRKPLPTALSTEHFDEAAILDGLRADFRVMHGHDCRAEFMAKDLHIVWHEPRHLR